MGIIAIVTGLISFGELTSKATDVAKKLIPDAPKSLQEKHRWVQCVIKNETQFPIYLEDTYFDSGRYWDAPGSIQPFSQMTFGVCNGDGTVATGVSGGTAFKIDLDEEHAYFFAIGWTNPQFGSFKAGVVESKNAVDGYNAASGNGGSINSSNTYEGKQKDGKLAKFTVHISAAPGQNALYVINQDMSPV